MNRAPNDFHSAPLIEIRDVTVRREQTTILDKISLRVPRHRHTAILGANGSGKSSLLKLLTRDFYPSATPGETQGQVEILGQSQWQLAQLRRRMGIVSPLLDAEFARGRTGRMSVAETIASGFTATALREFGPVLDEKVTEAVAAAADSVGAASLMNQSIAQLSTGQRRRVMIARAIVHKPDIFVLDEPTGGLDIAAKHHFLKTLQRITRRSDLTTLLVTHHIDEIPPAMCHVILLNHGRIVFDGDKADGLSSERISELFGQPIQITARTDGWYDSHVRR